METNWMKTEIMTWVGLVCCVMIVIVSWWFTLAAAGRAVDRRVEARLGPLLSELRDQRAAIDGFNIEHVKYIAQISELERQVLELKKRPPRLVVVRESERPLPVFARGRMFGR